MVISVTVDDATIRRIIAEYIERKMGEVSFKSDDVKIKVKCKRDFKAEWEDGTVTARLDKVE